MGGCCLTMRKDNEGTDTPLLTHTLVYDDMHMNDREFETHDQEMENVIQTLESDNFAFDHEKQTPTRTTNKQQTITDQHSHQPSPQQKNGLEKEDAKPSFGECTDCRKMANGRIYSEDGYDQFYCLECWSLYQTSSMSRSKTHRSDTQLQSNTNMTVVTAGHDASHSHSQSQFDDSLTNSMSTDAALMNAMINPSFYDQELKLPKQTKKKTSASAGATNKNETRNKCLDTPEMEKLTGASYIDSLDMLQTQILMEEHSDKLIKQNQTSNNAETMSPQAQRLDSVSNSMPAGGSYMDSLDVLQGRYLMQENQEMG